MNKESWISGITAFIIAAGGALGVVLVGDAAPTGWQVLAAICLGLVSGAKDVRALMKLPPLVPLFLLIGLVSLGLMGCATVFDTIVTIKEVGDTISREYAQLYKQGMITPEQDAKAEAAHSAYREAMAGLAITLEAAKASGDNSSVPAKLRAAKQAIDPLLDLITPLLTKQRANTLEQQLTKARAQ